MNTLVNNQNTTVGEISASLGDAPEDDLLSIIIRDLSL